LGVEERRDDDERLVIIIDDQIASIARDDVESILSATSIAISLFSRLAVHFFNR